MNFSSSHINARRRILASNLNGLAPMNERVEIPNIVKAKFDHLKETKDAFAGDPTKCRNCDAIFTLISHLSEPDRITGKRTWECEFCHFENKIMISDEEKKNLNNEVTFLLEPAPVEEEVVYNTVDTKYFVFCIDVSGSMSISSEVIDPNLKLATDKTKADLITRIDSCIRPEDGFVSPIPRIPTIQQAKRYITRLEAVQTAIDHSLNELVRKSPEKRVGLVTFNQKVNIIGDGKIPKNSFEGDTLANLKEIETVAKNTPPFDIVGRNKEKLREEVLKLEEGGATALGPALYYSVLVASTKPGGQVLLCTDGLANIGIGQLDVDETSREESIKFYNDLISLALTKGVSISIIAIEGTNTGLGILGDVAAKTRGSVRIVNPIRLTNEFPSIIEDKLIATNVKGILILPKELYVKDHEDMNNKQSKITKDIGNVTEETEVSFQFAVRENAAIDFTKVKKLPVQLQLEYTAIDGSKLLRVITQEENVTEDETIVERDVDRKIIASYAIRNQSELLQKGLKSEEVENIAQNVNNLKNQKKDNFSREAYNRVQNDLSEISKGGARLAPSSAAAASLQGSAATPLNAQVNYLQDADDVTATKFYKYLGTNTKNLDEENQ